MNEFLFGTYPYIALAVLAIGSIARYERDPFTWKSSSSQLLRRKQLIIGSVDVGEEPSVQIAGLAVSAQQDRGACR